MKGPFNHRTSVFVVTVGFIATVIYYYVDYLVPIWGYQGFNEFDPSRSSISLFLAIIYIISFIFVYPLEINQYSRFVVWILFYFLYLPSSIIVTMQGIPDDGGIVLVTCVTISFYIIAFIPEFIIIIRMSVVSSGECKKSVSKTILENNQKYRSVYDVHVITLSSLFLLIVFVYYSKIIGFISMLDVYDQRELAVIYSPNRALMSYVAQWSVRLVSPFLFAIGLIYRNKIALTIGFFGFLLNFFIAGSKFVIFNILLMLFMYRYVLSRRMFNGLYIGAFFWIGLVIPLFAVQFYQHGDYDFVGLMLSQILKRAYAVGGMTLGNYYDFFSENPYTYYSHLGPVGWFIDYPYGNFAIGNMVGHFQSGSYAYDMSANFWSTDGIAAAGYVGIIIIGLVLSLILSLFNVWTRPKYFVLVCLSSIGCIWMLADTSVFRVLMSGGWPLHFLFAHLYSSRLYQVRS